MEPTIIASYSTFWIEWINFSLPLFYTEAKAAFQAGFTTAVSERPGNAVLSETDRKNFRTISTFDELLPKTVTEESPRAKKSNRDY